MITIDHHETFAYPAAMVFAALADLQARQAWQPSLVAIRVEPEGAARLGTRIVETRKYPGRQSENTLTVSAFEPDRLLILETAPGIHAPIRERYQIEPITDERCRLACSTELGGIPRMFEFLVRQASAKELPQNFACLAALLAERTTRRR